MLIGSLTVVWRARQMERYIFICRIRVVSLALFVVRLISVCISIAHKCCVESLGRLRDTFTIGDAIVATIAGRRL